MNETPCHTQMHKCKCTITSDVVGGNKPVNALMAVYRLEILARILYACKPADPV